MKKKQKPIGRKPPKKAMPGGSAIKKTPKKGRRY